MPDSLIIVPEFPPSKGVIQALLDLGYYFSSSAALDLQVILRSFFRKYHYTTLLYNIILGSLVDAPLYRRFSEGMRNQSRFSRTLIVVILTGWLQISFLVQMMNLLFVSCPYRTLISFHLLMKKSRVTVFRSAPKSLDLILHLQDHKLVIHIVTEDNRAGKILRDTRDMCNSEEWAFNDYKAELEKEFWDIFIFQIGNMQNECRICL